MKAFILARRRGTRISDGTSCHTRCLQRYAVSEVQPISLLCVIKTVHQSHDFRPTEVEALLGHLGKAGKKLDWTPRTTCATLVAKMLREDQQAAEREELIKQHGYKAMTYQEKAPSCLRQLSL